MRCEVAFAVLLLATLLCTACSKAPREGAGGVAAAPVSAASAPSTTSRRVSGPEARALVERGALLVDVRTPGEFTADGIKGAINIPFDQVEARAAELGAKDRPMVLYCHSGRRSGIAARALGHLGYSVIYDLGPRTAW
jgi:phage shock protein E